MPNISESDIEKLDPAAVFACALSLREACLKRAEMDRDLNLSKCYNGMDEFMRELIRVASLFESWACAHVAFEETNDVWTYSMEAKFGNACLSIMSAKELATFDESDCLRVALCLRLPIKLNDSLRLPIDVTELNPLVGTGFRAFRIQTVRDSVDGDYTAPFTLDDNPFDEEFGVPYFGLYGLSEDGLLEHIADRQTYAEAVSLTEKLATGIQFPKVPISAASTASPARILTDARGPTPWHVQ